MAPRTTFFETPGHGSLKPIKSGLSQENQDEWNPYLHTKVNNIV